MVVDQPPDDDLLEPEGAGRENGGVPYQPVVAEAKGIEGMGKERRVD